MDNNIKDMDDYYNLVGAGIIGIDPFVATDDLPKSEAKDEGLVVYESTMGWM